MWGSWGREWVGEGLIFASMLVYEVQGLGFGRNDSHTHARIHARTHAHRHTRAGRHAPFSEMQKVQIRVDQNLSKLFFSFIWERCIEWYEMRCNFTEAGEVQLAEGVQAPGAQFGIRAEGWVRGQTTICLIPALIRIFGAHWALGAFELLVHTDDPWMIAVAKSFTVILLHSRAWGSFHPIDDGICE